MKVIHKYNTRFVICMLCSWYLKYVVLHVYRTFCTSSSLFTVQKSFYVSSYDIYLRAGESVFSRVIPADLPSQYTLWDAHCSKTRAWYHKSITYAIFFQCCHSQTCFVELTVFNRSAFLIMFTSLKLKYIVTILT